MVTVRLARQDDLARLPGIERAAGEVFRSLGMDAVADDEPPTVEELGRYQQRPAGSSSLRTTAPSSRTCCST